MGSIHKQTNTEQSNRGEGIALCCSRTPINKCRRNNKDRNQYSSNITVTTVAGKIH